MIHRGQRKRHTDESGQAAVEFAIVLPVLLLVLLGIIKFGILYNNYLQLTDAVRTGARTLAIERGQANPCADAVSAVMQAQGSLSITSITMSVNPAPTDGTPSSYTNGSGGVCPTLTSGNAATLSATYPCDLTFLGIDPFKTCKLTATSTERIE